MDIRHLLSKPYEDIELFELLLSKAYVDIELLLSKPLKRSLGALSMPHARPLRFPLLKLGSLTQDTTLSTK